MNQNKFREDSQDPIGKICCLQENGFRCQQQAGKASYDKKTCHTIQQIQFHLDAYVIYLLIVNSYNYCLFILYEYYFIRLATVTFVIITRI